MCIRDRNRWLRAVPAVDFMRGAEWAKAAQEAFAGKRPEGDVYKRQRIAAHFHQRADGDGKGPVHVGTLGQVGDFSRRIVKRAAVPQECPGIRTEPVAYTHLPVYLKPGDVVEGGSPAFGFASQAVGIDDEG